MGVFKIIEDRLMKESKVGIKLLKSELDFQKHRASDKLYDGFYARVEQKGNRIVMAVMNNADYMWTVNDGKAGGVNASYQQISAWALDKQDRGEIRFTSMTSLNNFISKVKLELEYRYLTAGGNKVAPRRYFFIDIVVEDIKKSGLGRRLEKDIDKQIKQEIGYSKADKIVKVGIS